MRLGAIAEPGTRLGWVTRSFRRVRDIVRRWRVGQRLSAALVLVALASTALTYAAFTGSVPFLPATPSTLLLLLNLDLVLLLALAVLVAYRAVGLWMERRRRAAGSGLHVRLVASFSLVAAAPAIVITTFSVVFTHNGLQGWFSSQVDSALSNSLTVAEAYLQEQSRAAARDALSIVSDLRRFEDRENWDPAVLVKQLEEHQRWRNLVAVALFDENGKVSARVGETEGMANERVPDWAVARARAGEVAVVVNRESDRMRALVRVWEEPDEFLYLGRAVDRLVLTRVGEVRAAVGRFHTLQTERAEIELTFAVMFAVLALLMVLIAIWFGLTIAGQLARPLSSLMEAAERVRAGDLEVRLDPLGQASEFQSLGRVFNRMTAQLRTQRQELMEANRQLDQRRRFTEAVLAGVAAGVIGLDSAGRIRYPNRMASQLLGLELDRYRDHELAELLPEVAGLLERGRRVPAMTAEEQLEYETADGKKTLLVRVTEELGSDAGMVVTFTDISDLLDAQRKAAWSDVARRIAHEIKNPLTPIQLSAERLKRKYLPEIGSDPDTFVQCTDTIVRQVDSLRRMVDEFSDFARMPAPIKEWCNFSVLVREAVALQQNAEPLITFAVLDIGEDFNAYCDQGQLTQVMTNVLQNASQAIAQRPQGAEGGQVSVTLGREDGVITVEVADNGVGLPPQAREKLADPYVTTKPKGTGLGLAIVQKIVNDHHGWIRFNDREGGGARVQLAIQADPPDEEAHGGA